MGKVIYRYVVLGSRDQKGTSKTLPGAQAEGDPGKNDANAGGDFDHGILLVQGKWNHAADFGAIEFPSLSSANAWLDSREGQHFKDNMPDVVILATFANCQLADPHS